MRARTLAAVVLIGGLAAAAQACVRHSTPVAEPVATLAVPDRSSSHVTLAAEGGRVAAAWLASADAGTDVYAAISRDAGRSFGAPVRVNDIPGDAAGNGEQPPRIVMKRDAVTVVWVSKREGVSGIRAAQSGDGGRTFAPARTISPDGVTGARGWESAAISDDGVLHAAWLDGRHASMPPAPADGATSAKPAAHVHGAAGHVRGAAQAAGAAPTAHMHGAMRQDIVHAMWRAGEPVVESPVAENVCFCCKTGVVTHGHDVFVVWRHLFPGGVRDIAIARSRDDGRTFGAPVRVSEDNWKIDACPDDGPSLGIEADGALRVAWPTLLQDGGQPHMAIFQAVSRDGGATFSPRERIDASPGGASHPRLAVGAGGSYAIAWDEVAAEGRRVMARTAGGAPQPIAEGGSASYPAVVEADDAFVFAWTEQAAGHPTVRVQRSQLKH